MANILSWHISTLETYPEQYGQEHVVYGVHWRLLATSESGSYTAERYGETQVTPYTSGSLFIPFQDLTKEIVVGWVTSSWGEERYNQITASLNADIHALMYPTTQVLPPPWTN